MQNITAVNRILAALGETPLDALGGEHPMEATILSELTAIHGREQARGWWFNTSGSSPYNATTVAFDAAPESFAQYVVALAQVLVVKNYDGDENKVKLYGAEAALAASVVLGEHLRNVTVSLDSTIAGAVSALFRVADEAAGGDPLFKIEALLGANRIDRLATKTLTEMSEREQAQGWWFNTSGNTVSIAAVGSTPAAFQEWVTSLSAVRIAQVYAAPDVLVKQLREESHRAAAIVLTIHLNQVLDARASTFAAATGALIRVAEEAAGGPDALHRSIAMVGANRVDRVIDKALLEISRREQAHGWWFNTDEDTGDITILDLDDEDLPAEFLEYVSSLAAIRVGKTYNASQAKLQALQEEVARAYQIFHRRHIKESAVNMQETNLLVQSLVNNYGYRYRVR